MGVVLGRGHGDFLWNFGEAVGGDEVWLRMDGVRRWGLIFSSCDLSWVFDWWWFCSRVGVDVGLGG